MSPSQPDRSVVCSQCGAVLGPQSTRCWLCYATPTTGRAAPAPYEHDAPWQFGLSSLMLVVTFAAVVCGVFSISPGLGLAVCIVSAPALVRTCLVVTRRKSRGRSVSGVEKTVMYLESFFVTAIILSILGVAAFGTFFAACLGAAQAFDIESAMSIGIMAAVLATALVAWPLALWVRRRWRRAVRDKNGRPT